MPPITSPGGTDQPVCPPGIGQAIIATTDEDLRRLINCEERKGDVASIGITTLPNGSEVVRVMFQVIVDPATGGFRMDYTDISCPPGSDVLVLEHYRNYFDSRSFNFSDPAVFEIIAKLIVSIRHEPEGGSPPLHRPV